MKTSGLKIETVLLIFSLILPILAGCSAQPASSGLGNGMQALRSLELQYAKQFTVDYYENDLKLITVNSDQRYLIVPEGQMTPAGIDPAIQVLHSPLSRLYLAASAAMSHFDALDAIPNIRCSGIRADRWANLKAVQAMESGQLLFAGKYNEPDYELLVSENISLAIESTMIRHSPEVAEKLKELGVPVFVDFSSHEPHPLGRSEWIRCYGALLGLEEQADPFFFEQVRLLEEASRNQETGKTVAFFYISSNGNVVTRKSGDYVSKMIELAGGKYIFDRLGDTDSAMSSVNLDMEEFYASAKDADFIVYNSAIAGEIRTLAELLDQNPLLRDFKAVQEGRVWCTSLNLYQESSRHAEIILDFNRMLESGDDPGLKKLQFLYRLE